MDKVRILKRNQSILTIPKQIKKVWKDSREIEEEIPEQTFKGAVFPIGSDDYKNYDFASLTANDRKLYCTEQLKDECKIIYAGKAYNCQGIVNYGEISELRVYILKRVDEIE